MKLTDFLKNYSMFAKLKPFFGPKKEKIFSAHGLTHMIAKWRSGTSMLIKLLCRSKSFQSKNQNKRSKQ